MREIVYYSGTVLEENFITASLGKWYSIEIKESIETGEADGVIERFNLKENGAFHTEIIIPKTKNTVIY